MLPSFKCEWMSIRPSYHLISFGCVVLAHFFLWLISFCLEVHYLTACV